MTCVVVNPASASIFMAENMKYVVRWYGICISESLYGLKLCMIHIIHEGDIFYPSMEALFPGLPTRPLDFRLTEHITLIVQLYCLSDK